jgi:hypothetical protein
MLINKEGLFNSLIHSLFSIRLDTFKTGEEGVSKGMYNYLIQISLMIFLYPYIQIILIKSNVLRLWIREFVKITNLIISVIRRQVCCFYSCIIPMLNNKRRIIGYQRDSCVNTR